MIIAGRQRLEGFWLLMLLGTVALATVLAAAFPAVLPWCYLALGCFVLVCCWAVRWEITLWAWIWVLSYGLLDAGFWKLEVPGFFNLTIPRLIFVAAVIAFGMHFLIGRARPRFDRAIQWVMLALTLYCAGSATLKGWHAETPQVASAPYYRFMVAMLFPFLMFTLVYSCTHDRKQIRWALIPISLYGWYALYLSYLQYAAIMGWAGARAWIWPKYINDPNYGIHFDRARGAFVAAGPQSVFLVLLFFVVLYLIRKIRGPYRYALIVQAILTPPAIFFTGIRAAYVAFVICGVLWCILTSRRHFGTVKLGFAAVAMILGASMFWGNLMQTRRQTGGIAQKGPIVSRKVLLYQSWEIFRAHPLTGVGFGHFVDAQQSLERDPASIVGLSTGVVVQHNLFLNMAAETGIVGLVGVLAVFLLVYRQSYQLYRKLPQAAGGDLSRDFVVLFWVIMLNYLVAAMFRDTFWDVSSNAMFWSLAGLVVGYNRLLEHRSAPQLLGVLQDQQ